MIKEKPDTSQNPVGALKRLQEAKERELNDQRVPIRANSKTVVLVMPKKAEDPDYLSELESRFNPKNKKMEAKRLKTVKIVIQDATGENPGLILELSKVGVPIGTVVEGILNEVSGAVYFTSGCEDCIAWLHETCEIITP